MRLITSLLFTALILVTAFSSAFGQAGREVKGNGQDSSQARSTTQTTGTVSAANETPAPTDAQAKQPIWIYLVGGGRIQVDEVTESAEGMWYKRSNLSTFIDRARVERIERDGGTKPKAQPENIQVSSNWNISDAGKVENFFVAKFGRRLPLTAFGQSVMHTSWRLDHRNSMDVGLHPDSQEGRALIKYLRSEGIPFLAFRGAVPGAATGPHIHIGKPSHRLPAR